MKKLILLLALVAIVMTGCHQHVTDYGIVEKVEFYNNTVLSSNYHTKYRVQISTGFNTRWMVCSYLYTNQKYEIGDTIIVTKKNYP